MCLRSTIREPISGPPALLCLLRGAVWASHEEEMGASTQSVARQALGEALAVVEAYSPTTNAWIKRAPLPNKRRNLSAAANGAGLIYAIGGATGFYDYVRTTTVYSPGKNKWWMEDPTRTAHVDAAAATSKYSRIFIISGLTTGGGTTAAVESRPGFCDVCQ
jgi:hypothetical protein